jgi:lipopolysaccharide transport protein LptA
MLLAGGPAGAQGGGKSVNDSLRPSGPVTITADRAEWEQDGAMVYSGNVLLTSDTLKLVGDRLELRQFAGGDIEAKITGNPARMDHPGLVEKNGEPGPPVSAQARTLTYDSRSSMVDLTGNGRLTRGQDAIDGEDIRYDVAARRIRAIGGESGQVKIVIQPPPPRRGAPAPKPTTERPAPPAPPAESTP